MASINGTNGADSLTGTSGDDTVLGNGGNDTLIGMGGNDSLGGGDGGDNLYGDDFNAATPDGNDSVDGGLGDDTVYGNGGEGNDKLYGDDFEAATVGDNDWLDGGPGDDTLYGNAGNDTLSGASGSDFADGGEGNDSFDGGLDNDRLFGQEGDDALNGGEGNDSLYGDNFNATTPDGNDSLDGGVGDDTIYGNGGRDRLIGGEGSDKLYGDDFETTTVGDDDSLDGGAGDDTLYGNGGDDVLDGGPGGDFLAGGAGDDIYLIDDRNDYVFEQADEGIDSAIVSVNGVKLNLSTVEHVVYADDVLPLAYWVDALVGDNVSYLSEATSVGIRYAFPNAGRSEVGFVPFSEEDKATVRQALGLYAAAINAPFVEVEAATPGLKILFFYYDIETYDGLGGLGGVYIDVAYAGGRLRSPDARPYQVLVHETGHALGLKHPGNYTGWFGAPGVLPFLPASEDEIANSRMSYNYGSVLTPDWQSSIGPFDVAAAQFLYGVNPNLNAGNTLYRYGGLVWPDTNLIKDGGGIDTFDASSVSLQVAGAPYPDMTIDLREGSRSFAGAPQALISAPGQVSINYSTVIENAIGSKGRDNIVGNTADNLITSGAGNDTLNGGGGNDTLDGGTGIDRAVFGAARSAATLARTAEGYTLSSVPDGSDTLKGIERLKFSDKSVALDVGANQSAGGTALLIGAVLPGQLVYDASKQPLLGTVIDLFDQGFTLRDLSGALLRLNRPDVHLWDILTNQATPTNRDIANYLLTNVNGQVPDAASLNAAAAALATESFQGDWLAGLAGGAQNQVRLGLVGLLDTGLEFQALP